MISKKVKYFVPKVINRLAFEKNRIWKHCDVNRISMYGFKPFVSEKAFKSRIQEMLGKYDANILMGISNEDEKLIIACADQALRHESDLLGSGPVTMNPIDWHTDFKTGARWDKKFYRDIVYIKGADIKVPWELSRCQHLLWLGEAYLLTEQDKYAQEIIDVINWWIDDNPLMYTVNWKCAMDVAFRAVNWMFALNMIADFSGYDDKFRKRVEKSLWQHGFFIRNNLEKQIPFSNNHYISDIVGLLYIGCLFIHTKKSQRWYSYAINEYFSEICKQVLDSGVHYERSISYHRMMTEILSYPIYMLQRINESIPKGIIERLTGMYAFVNNYTKPNGFAPLCGDNDDGRFLPFLKRDFRYHNYLNTPLSVENRFVALDRFPLFVSTKKESRLYKDAGFVVSRHGGTFLFICHGGFSMNPKESDELIGSHTHNDLLSFELNFEGKDILVDAGSYLYTSSIAERNEFRSTAKHNTIEVDGEEQNGFAAAFMLKRNTHKTLLTQIEENMYEGSYTTINGRMLHTRRFKNYDKGVVIIDSIKKAGSHHMANLYFHFAEGETPNFDGVKITSDNVHISFDASLYHVDIVDDTLSPSFGVLTSSKTAIASFLFDNSIIIETRIEPVKNINDDK